MNKYFKLIFDRKYRFNVLASRGWYDKMSDEKYLKKKFKFFSGKKLDLENPKTICEKLQWLKLFDRKDVYTQMVDKYEVKKIVSEKLGEEHVIPLLGVWDSFDDINFDELPDQFVLKCTHDSGSFAICKDKKTFNKEEAREKLTKGLKRNYFYGGREWPYKNVKPRIIAEKYIDSLGKKESVEYKVTCFNGKVGFVTICTGIAHSKFEDRTNDHYDVNFNHMPWYSYYENSKEKIEKPAEWEQIIEFSEKLAKDVPYLRVDFYPIDGKLYFGEMTFYTWSGFIKFSPEEWDYKLGEMLILPEKK